MEKMLINATHADELRVAIVNDNYLCDLDIERRSARNKANKADIYKGRITRLEPSLEAAFVEFGSSRQGFLPLKEIAKEYYFRQPEAVVAATAENDSETGDNGRSNTPKPSIKDLLKEGQEIIIQIEKEERGTKGAALSSYISLAGCYLVLMPNNPKGGGISRRIEGNERDELRNTLAQLNIPEGMSIIVRTAGLGKNVEDLQWDLDVLVNQWHAIQQAADKQPAPFLIHQDGDVIIRSIRDNLRKTVTEIIIDESTAFAKAKHYIEQVKPEFLSQLKLYQDNIPLFNRHQIESQIEAAYQRVIPLPSGGSIVIDPTEALVSIDINSAKATGAADIETTALNTNLEAADEIARQMRLRDIGGLIVIDFIDMTQNKHQREVENRLREALRPDRARVQLGRISRFGLLEMSRQRLRLSLGDSTQEVCPRCDGRATIRSVLSLGLSILRLMEEEALKPGVKTIHAQLPIDVATFILNERRHLVEQIEKRHNVGVLVLPNTHLESPHYQIEGIKTDDRKSHKSKASYELVQTPELQIVKTNPEESTLVQPAIQLAVPTTSPSDSAEQQGNFIKRLWTGLFGSSSSPATDATPPATTAQKPKSRGRQNNNRQQQGRKQQQSRNKNQSSSRGGNRGGGQNKRGGGQNKRNNNQQSRQAKS